MARQSKTMRGRPGDVARELLDGGHHAEVLALVEKLAAKNEELERIIASARVRNRSEVVPSEQLALILEELRTNFPGQVFDVVIKDSVRVKESPAAGLSIFDYDHSHEVAKAYMRLAQEVDHA